MTSLRPAEGRRSRRPWIVRQVTSTSAPPGGMYLSLLAIQVKDVNRFGNLAPKAGEAVFGNRVALLPGHFYRTSTSKPPTVKLGWHLSPADSETRLKIF